MHGDRNRLFQVFSNLLSNALKYGHRSPVRVKLESPGGVVRVLVRDEGPGIAKESLERIFHRFERASPADNLGGLGLGLYISRQLVHAHGGKIWADSEPRKGATFLVEIPASTALSSAAG